MYELIIANKNYSSWSMRPWVLMRALNIPFQERLLVFGKASDLALFKELSPSGLVPCLIDGATRVWDSLAIAEYLAERYLGVWPATSDARAWARSAAAEMHSGFGALRNRCSMSIGLRVRLRETPPALRRDLARLDQLWSEGLNRHGGPFLGGRSFGAVDAFFAPVAMRAQTYGLKFSAHAEGYLQLLRSVPAVREWEEAALIEPYREEAHEKDSIEAGEILQDLRR